LAIDITKQKETENTLRKTQQTLINKSDELTKLNATKDKFFSIIAHDLKNPFNSIMGFANILSRKIDTLQKEQIKDHAEQIYDSSKSAYKLLENLLEWSRSQMGKISFAPENFNLYDLMDEVIVSIYSQATSKQVKIDIQVPQNFEMYGDRNMIATVLRNLVSNAIKFSHRKSKVLVSANAYALRVPETQPHTIVTITDFGLGISETLQKKLFNISEKTTTPGTEKEHGTGLGLLLCKEFIDKHNGYIDIESEIGKGSTFSVILPSQNTDN
jgi:signal transduction histidine kinase